MFSSRRTWAQSNSVSRRTPALWLCHLILKSLQHVQWLWKIVWIFLKKTKNIWSNNPTLGIHLEKMKTPIWKDTITPMFIATLCIIAKKWKKPVSTDRWMDKEDVIHIYMIKYYSATKKNETMSFAATWMDLEIIILHQRKTHIIWSHLKVGSRIRHKWTYMKNRNRPTETENKLWFPKGKAGEG